MQGRGPEQPELIAAHAGGSVFHTGNGCSAASDAQVQQLQQQLDAAAAQQRAMQERVRQLTAQNEELVIARNAILSDLMVSRSAERAQSSRGFIQRKSGGKRCSLQLNAR